MSEKSRQETIEESRRHWREAELKAKRDSESFQVGIDRAVADFWEVVNQLVLNPHQAAEKARDALVALEAHLGSLGAQKNWP